MNKNQAKVILAKQAEFLEKNGHFAGLAPGVQGSDLRRAERIISGEEKENEKPEKYGRIVGGNAKDGFEIEGGKLHPPHQGHVIPKGEGLPIPHIVPETPKAIKSEADVTEAEPAAPASLPRRRR